MIAVVVHTYTGGYGDMVQLAGVFDSLEKAQRCERHLLEYFLNESNLNNPEKDLDYARKKFIVNLLPLDINREYSVELEDDADLFKETLYYTDADPIDLGGYME